MGSFYSSPGNQEGTDLSKMNPSGDISFPPSTPFHLIPLFIHPLMQGQRVLSCLKLWTMQAGDRVIESSQEDRDMGVLVERS